VDEESSDLHLADGIESDDADVGIRESLGALLDLSDDLRTILAAEHGELPHGPVAVVEVVARNSSETDGVGGGGVGIVGVSELEARSPSVADNVVDLPGDLTVRERGEEREGLEELQDLEIRWGEW
jgi:hypothetical protein